jgi:DNA polymerase-3 subunit gamma/tau
MVTIVGDLYLDLRTATDQRLVVEIGLARAAVPEASLDAEALLARIERLERRLSIAGAEPPTQAAPGPAVAEPATRPAPARSVRPRQPTSLGRPGAPQPRRPMGPGSPGRPRPSPGRTGQGAAGHRGPRPPGRPKPGPGPKGVAEPPAGEAAGRGRGAGPGPSRPRPGGSLALVLGRVQAAIG